ncbi:MAG TPA: DUF4105 domain-containing protein [Gemmatimonadales bacterium]|nr:DUF4105 domain-containing protein [Gemmatimonadales bacterium]
MTRSSRLAFSLALLGAAPLAAQAGASPAEPGSELVISLITMGPGELVWERFGHNAIRVTDTRTGSDLAYNYGMFDFEAEHFFTNFARGRMDYWMQPQAAEGGLGQYVRRNRSVFSQRLNLTPRQRLELREFLEWNARPENRFYRYHYFYDNCSTRVRDALDRVLGGALRSATEGTPSGVTYRSETRRLTANDPLIYTGINIGLGRPTDREISRWEEMFLPLAVREYVRTITVPDDAGAMRPLVAAEDTLYLSTAEPPPAGPPRWWPRFLIAGVAVGALLAALGRGMQGSGAARVAFAILGGAWTLIAGLSGVVLAGLWLFTDHVTSYANENLLQLSPLSLALAVLIPVLAFRPDRPWIRTRRLALVVAALSVLGLLITLIPGSQVNGEVIALALPMHVGVWWGVRGRR